MIHKISNWEVARLAFFLFVASSVLLVFILTPNLFPSALISTLLYFVFAPSIDSLERKGVPRTSAILGVFLICGLAIGFMASRLAPRFSAEVSAFQQGNSRYSSNIVERLRHQEATILGDSPMFKNLHLTDKLVSWLNQSTDRLWATMPNFATHLLMCLFLVPFLTFILLNDAHEIRRNLLKLVPNRHFETVYSLLSRILDEMGGYVSARILEAVLVAAMVTISCLVLKIPYAVLLGVFAGATNAIPYLGPLIGAMPGMLLAVLEPAIPNQLLWVTVIYALANIIDMIVVFPLVVAKIVDLHPVVVVLSVVLGSQIFGIVGMIVAVPITSILKILILEMYSRLYDANDVIR